MAEPVFNRYADWCGPQAFAAVAGIPADDAARSLERWKSAAAWEPSPGTSAAVLAMALINRGFDLEPWSVERSGWRLETGDEFADSMRRRYRAETQRSEVMRELQRATSDAEPAPVPSPEEQRALSRQRAKGAQRRRLRAPWRMCVRDWLHVRRAGTWILCAETGPGHWIAARWGWITAGDTPSARNCGGCPLRSAWRVIPPKPLETEL